jgi:hypothetical protein
LPASSCYAPPELSRGHRWLNRWWPSRRLRWDPLQGLRIDERYAPVSIANWKLVPTMARILLARRVTRPLSFHDDRRLTVVIPYRDRAEHLARLLPQLTARLREQNINYRILVVEQEVGEMFNRGRLLNAGMQYAADFSDYYCFHDVDTVPIVANYACPSQPLRLVNTVQNQSGERAHMAHYFSGAISIRKDQAFAVNGFSNEYWGWGKEDDDFYFRLLLAGFVCYFDLKGSFQDLPNPPHQCIRRAPLPPTHLKLNRRRRSLLLRGLTVPADDGVKTLKFNVVERVVNDDYEHITVRW